MVKSATKLIVHGTVQGVFFRQFVKDNADKLGLRGFVRNMDDKSVEVILEGDREPIERMTELVRKGPEHSMIKNVDSQERKWSGEFKDFKILRF